MLESIVAFIFGLLISYISTYARFKGQNRALIEDASRLENEKQKITDNYNRKIEELKKEHTLDIERRKYQYESKRDEYTKFMELLNDIQTADANLLMRDLAPALEAYYEILRSGSMERVETVRKEFNRKLADAQSFRGQQSLLVFNKSNSIKLIATVNVAKLIDKLIELLDESLLNTNKAIKYLGSSSYIYTRSLPREIIESFENNTSSVDETRRSLIAEMKKDLDTI